MQNWKDASGNLNFYYKSEEARENRFMFSIPDDIPGEKIIYDGIEDEDWVSFLSGLLEGRIEYSRKDALSAWRLYNYVLTWSYIKDYVCYHTEVDAPDEVISITDLISFLCSERGGLSASAVREIASHYMHDSEFLGGLNYCLLKAPEECGFVLSDVPFLFFNPFQKGRETANGEDITGYGIITVLVISPGYALCFYDDDVYRVKKTNGVAVLDRDDMNELHAHLLERSTAAVYRPDRTTVRNLDLLCNVDDSYLYNTVHEGTDDEDTFLNLNLSVLSVKAKAEEKVTGGKSVPWFRTSYISSSYSYFDEKELNASLIEKYLSRYDS